MEREGGDEEGGDIEFSVSPEVEELLAQHNKQKQALKAKERTMHFSHDLEATLTDAEREANVKILEMRD